MRVSVHAAQTRLPELLDAARAGEEVIIADADRPAVKLVPVTRSGFRFGGLEHLAGTAPDFLEPMSEEDLHLWEGGDECNR
ncbi:MAG TPA: type II toxin-antitoxin system prevent-host-death family antitoxin [Mesorhizobium sp.]|jgi:prevent-host-death family protein|nr:type II toxin-antitoxin system prevent-host-death family antitoxin [Mesorhizobium sp.]